MIRFSDYFMLQEGLVKVPPAMLRDLENFAGYFYIYEIEMRAEEMLKTGTLSKETYDKVKDAIKIFRSTWKIVRPQNAKKWQGAFWREIKFDKRFMPAHYKLGKQDEIKFVVDNSGQYISHDSQAVWKPASRMIVYNTSVRRIESIFKQRNVKSMVYEIDFIFRDTRASLEHELVHMVQEVIVPDDSNQVARKKGYNDSDVDYYTSPLEFEAQIVTAVREFQAHIRTMNFIKASNKDFRLDAEVFVGLKKAKMGMKVSPFFKNLKDNAQTRYQAAVKKFMMEVSPLF